MAHINKQRPNTRLQIIQTAAKLYIENGYSKTTNKELATLLDVSPGNITFYFPTKDHLLAVLVNELCDFQSLLIEQAAEEGKSSLLAYCLELTIMAALSEDNEQMHDFYVSTYRSPMTLEIIRQNDTEKLKRVFADYGRDWSDERFYEVECIVSGIEYATLMTPAEIMPLPTKIRNALNAVMLLLGVPEELRSKKIEKVLAMDYRAIGQRLFNDFKAYTHEKNEQAVEQMLAAYHLKND